MFVFRGRRGDLIEVLWYDGDGLCLFAKRLERGRFVWPQAASGTVSLTRAQLSMLLEGIDWRRPERTWDRSCRCNRRDSLHNFFCAHGDENARVHAILRACQRWRSPISTLFLRMRCER